MDMGPKRVPKGVPTGRSSGEVWGSQYGVIRGSSRGLEVIRSGSRSGFGGRQILGVLRMALFGALLERSGPKGVIKGVRYGGVMEHMVYKGYPISPV